MIATRSWLFVPGDRPDRFDRAYVSGADRVIVDLEDAVAPDHKDEARRAIAAWLTPRQPVFVRVNAPGSTWFTDDLDAVCKPGLAGIMVPKAEEVAAVRQAARMLVGLEGDDDHTACRDSARDMGRASSCQFIPPCGASRSWPPRSCPRSWRPTGAQRPTGADRANTTCPGLTGSQGGRAHR